MLTKNKSPTIIKSQKRDWDSAIEQWKSLIQTNKMRRVANFLRYRAEEQKTTTTTSTEMCMHINTTQQLGTNISQRQSFLSIACFVINLFLVLLTSTFNTHYTGANKQLWEFSYSNYVDRIFYSLTLSLCVCVCVRLCVVVVVVIFIVLMWYSFSHVVFPLPFAMRGGLWVIFYERNRL